MYINKVKINNVRAIEQLELTFPDDPAGWHVIIGDNASGKSTVLQAIALALIGPSEEKALQINLKDWLRKLPPAGKDTPSEQTSSEAEIEVRLTKGSFDGHVGNQRAVTKGVTGRIKFGYDNPGGERNARSFSVEGNKGGTSSENHNWSSAKGWFSAGFGPFRKFGGGELQRLNIERASEKAAAHATLFQENVDLGGAMQWLMFHYFQAVDNKLKAPLRNRAEKLLELLIDLVNRASLLPTKTSISHISSQGVFFKDADGVVLDVSQLSDGFRSILSLAFELVHRFCEVYDEQVVFDHTDRTEFCINLPGVVLIDEVDAHLHPTWQNTIGEWFTKTFPLVQFIVATHSPLVCRAADQDTIWQLPQPGSNEVARQITGDEKKRLIYGSIGDAFNTELFGTISRWKRASELLNRLAHLSALDSFDKLNQEQKRELLDLRRILPTDDPTGF